MRANSASPGPVIWVIDSRQWDRAYLRAELMARGFDAVGFEDATQALASLPHAGRAMPRVIVLELRDLALTRAELTALAGLGAPLIALGGAPELDAEGIRDFPWAAVLRRPFSIGDAAAATAKLVSELPN